MNIKTIRTLVVQFSTPLQSWQISAFRGAIIEKVGREHTLFNNHLDENKFHYRYPLVQYKSIRKKPAILCLGDGVDEIHKFFNQPSWEINLNGERVVLEIERLDLKNFPLKMETQSQTYQLRQWLGLNTKNFKRYENLPDELDRLEMLEKILVGNMLSFAKGMDWYIEEEVKIRITKIQKTKMIKYKNTSLKAFDVEFKTNVSLPYYIGLGKGASKGFGVIYPINNKNKIK